MNNNILALRQRQLVHVFGIFGHIRRIARLPCRYDVKAVYLSGCTQVVSGQQTCFFMQFTLRCIDSVFECDLELLGLQGDARFDGLQLEGRDP